MAGVNLYQGSASTERQGFFSRKADFLDNTAFSNSFWRIAILTAAGFLATAPGAEAATFWGDSDVGISRPLPPGPQQRRHKARRHQGAAKGESAVRESAKPQGPLIIAISIERQSLKVYDANGLFAETPVSTGMRGHSTPMGVFSIIQKHKFHRSNIYSGAPMPYMQRITWSGVAMHAGVLPGYPASHGCIRMPMSFAVKMWGWTRMGARVVVTPGEMTPSQFSHPLLTAQKPAPSPVASAVPSTAKSDKAPIADPIIAPAISEAAPAIKREQAQTADASSALPPSRNSATMSDATPSGGPAPTAGSDTSSAQAKPEAAEDSGKRIDTAAAEEASKDKPVEDKVVVAETRPAETTAAESDKPEIRPTLTEHTMPAPADSAAKAAAPALEAMKAEAAKSEFARSADIKADAPKLAEKPDDKAAPVADLKKDQARPSEPEKTAVAKPDPAAAPKRTGQIAVFVSRKDNKIYVRQNFAPLFEAPVTIAPSDRPLGTHVFTAQADKDDAKTFRWSVVSLPTARYAERRDDDERASRRRKTVGAVEMKPAPLPDSPTEALDRITIADDVMARISDALSTGGSIVVSDQGIAAGETGEGTDFIVSLR
jgi:L,D-transpeptidase-like protein